MVSEREQRKKNTNVCFSTLPPPPFRKRSALLARRRISDRRPTAPYAYAIRILQTDPGILHGVARTSAILTSPVPRRERII